MRTFTDNEFALYEKICCMGEQQLFLTMKKVLSTKYNNIIIEKDKYIVAIGDIPIALVAHLDTVFDRPPQEVYYDMRKGVCWAQDGGIGDDRAGVFAILNLIQRKLRPSIIFTLGEEQGGVGATALAEKPCPIPNLKYMIELDRQGENDAVFYQCYCPTFMSYIEDFGFLEKRGSYSDISFLMEKWQICGVNLSTGYFDEHSYSEILNVNALFATIGKVEKMLRDAHNIPVLHYEENKSSLTNWYRSNGKSCDFDYEQYLTSCDYCGTNMFDFEAVKVEGSKICPNCYKELFGGK